MRTTIAKEFYETNLVELAQLILPIFLQDLIQLKDELTIANLDYSSCATHLIDFIIMLEEIIRLDEIFNPIDIFKHRLGHFEKAISAIESLTQKTKRITESNIIERFHQQATAIRYCLDINTSHEPKPSLKEKRKEEEKESKKEQSLVKGKAAIQNLLNQTTQSQLVRRIIAIDKLLATSKQIDIPNDTKKLLDLVRYKSSALKYSITQLQNATEVEKQAKELYSTIASCVAPLIIKTQLKIQKAWWWSTNKPLALRSNLQNLIEKGEADPVVLLSHFIRAAIKSYKKSKNDKVNVKRSKAIEEIEAILNEYKNQNKKKSEMLAKLNNSADTLHKQHTQFCNSPWAFFTRSKSSLERRLRIALTQYKP